MQAVSLRQHSQVGNRLLTKQNVALEDGIIHFAMTAPENFEEDLFADLYVLSDAAEATRLC